MFSTILKLKDLPPGTKQQVLVGDTLVLLANVEGTLYALQDTCTHAETSLSEGELIRFSIECPLHGARFDVRTGKVKSLPAAEPLRTYAVKVEGEDVLIEVPEKQGVDLNTFLVTESVGAGCGDNCKCHS